MHKVYRQRKTKSIKQFAHRSVKMCKNEKLNYVSSAKFDFCSEKRNQKPLSFEPLENGKRTHKNFIAFI